MSIDYGTMNAFAAGLWAKYGAVWYMVDEYYYSGRDEGVQKTDEEYAQALDSWLAPLFGQNSADNINALYRSGESNYGENRKLRTIIDPSAASFIALLRKRKKYHVIPADNAVLDGIRETATCMQTGKIKISPRCKNWKKEVQGYVWDEDAAEDRPVKVADHLQDSVRYFVKTMQIVKPKNKYVPTYLR